METPTAYTVLEAHPHYVIVEFGDGEERRVYCDQISAALCRIWDTDRTLASPGVSGLLLDESVLVELRGLCKTAEQTWTDAVVSAFLHPKGAVR